MIDIMVVQSPHPPLPLPPPPPPQVSSSSSSTTLDNDGLHQETNNTNNEYNRYIQEEGSSGSSGRRKERKRREREQEGGDHHQVSLLAVLVTVFRKSLVACKSSEQQQFSSSSSGMEISWPDNVRHVAHVTFDRFNGFLGLPVEFEPDVPRRPPSASIRVFGVSTESMQLSFDSRGNSVPTILLMMQRRLYSQGGLQAEGIFRINAENGQEEYVREQLNSGVIPDDIDVHCLAGLIKAWFRELPRGILDSLSAEQVMQAQTEDECVRLVRLLPPTEAALLDWAINLMADVAQLENYNKMNARNIAMVFAPNMTQMADPLTALMYAVQVMNFLKTLVTRTLRDREDSVLEPGPAPNIEPSDENGHYGVSQSTVEENTEVDSEEKEFMARKPFLENDTPSTPVELRNGKEVPNLFSTIENILRDEKAHIVDKHYSSDISNGDKAKDGIEGGEVISRRGKTQSRNRRAETQTSQSSVSDRKRGAKKINQRSMVHEDKNSEKNRDISVISRLNTQLERAEAWR